MTSSKPDPTLSILEATNARIQMLDESVKRSDARLIQRLNTLASRIDALAMKMDAFLEGLNPMERGIDRICTTWEAQQRLQASMMENQQSMIASLSQMMSQQARMVERLLDVRAS